MRGLKLILGIMQFGKYASHLLQMRGLKRLPLYGSFNSTVASFTDAWIETILNKMTEKVLMVASFTDAWIETNRGGGIGSAYIVASFTDAWIETSFGIIS